MFLWEVIENNSEIYKNTHEYWKGEHSPPVNDYIEVFQKDLEKIIKINYNNDAIMLEDLNKMAHRTYTSDTKNIFSSIWNPWNYYFGNLIVSCCQRYIYEYLSDFDDLCTIQRNRNDDRELTVTGIWFDYKKLVNFLNGKINDEAYDLIKRYPTFLKQFGEGRPGLGKIEITEDNKKIMFKKVSNNFSCYAFTYVENKKKRVVSAPQEAIFQLLLANDIPCRQEYPIVCNGHNRRFDIAVYDDKGLSYFIEYDSEIHYKPIDYFGGEEKYQMRVDADTDKTQWAKEHGVPLIRIPYTLKNLSIEDCKLESSRYITK